MTDSLMWHGTWWALSHAPKPSSQIARPSWVTGPLSSDYNEAPLTQATPLLAHIWVYTHEMTDVWKQGGSLWACLDSWKTKFSSVKTFSPSRRPLEVKLCKDASTMRSDRNSGQGRFPNASLSASHPSGSLESILVSSVSFLHLWQNTWAWTIAWGKSM